jgi:hypothetical protein
VLSVVVPTIEGREDSYLRCVNAYHDSLDDGDYEIVRIVGAANWPTACNRGARRAIGDVLHFTSDDLEPLPGWHVDALALLAQADELPAPRVMNYTADGVWDNACDGPDGALTHFTRIPIMRRDQYDRIGPWPEIDYGADVWLSEKGRVVGIQTRMVHSYSFIHHWNQVGRLDDPGRLAEAARALEQHRAALA